MKNCSITILTNKRKVIEYETTLVVMPSEFIMYFHQGAVFMSSIGKYKSTLIRSLIWIPVTVSHCRVTCNAIISCIYRSASPLHVSLKPRPACVNYKNHMGLFAGFKITQVLVVSVTWNNFSGVPLSSQPT